MAAIITLTDGTELVTNLYKRMDDGRTSVFTTDGGHRHVPTVDIASVVDEPTPAVRPARWWDLAIAADMWAADGRDTGA